MGECLRLGGKRPPGRLILLDRRPWVRQDQRQVGYQPPKGGRNYNYPDDENIEEWLFGDAPRALRLQAIDKLPT